MEIIFLGQAGLLFRKGDFKILIDPYLSNSVEKVNPKNYRRLAVDESFFDIKPDVMIFTHDHLDHYDPETVEKFLMTSERAITVLSPSSVWNKVRAFGGDHNYILFDRHTEWTVGGICFLAVKAQHSDPCAIGVILEDLSENKKYYVTGDTLYNSEIFDDIPMDIHVLFLPINGVGNNMNAHDASRFAKRIGAQITVPLHFGMFDELTPDIFTVKNTVVPEIYKKINIKD